MTSYTSALIQQNIRATIYIYAKIKIIILVASDFDSICYLFVIMPLFYILFKAEKRNGNMTAKEIDICQYITFIQKKPLKNLCPRAQIINFASCSRECNVFSLG